MPRNIVLHQFCFSNFCEKVRWALEYRDLPFESREYLPFWHIRPIKRLSSQSAVPVIEIDGQVQANSPDIISLIDDGSHADSLYPADPELRQQALDWQRRLDDSGATIRGAMFHDFMEDRQFFFNIIVSGQSGAWRLRLYGVTFILIYPLMKKILNKRAPDPVQLRNQITALIDDIVVAQSGCGYLVGDCFSIADLAAASLLYPLYFPDRTAGRDVVNTHPAGRQWLQRWEAHAVGDYVKRIYRNHRHKL